MAFIAILGAVVLGFVLGVGKLSDHAVGALAGLGWSSSSSAPSRCCC